MLGNRFSGAPPTSPALLSALLTLGSVLLFAIVILGGAVPVEAREHSMVFPPQATPYGKSYGEWAATALDRGFSTVWDPLACSVGRVGHVEMLQDNFGGTSVFDCDVPVGTAFLVNVVSAFLMCPGDCGPDGAAPNGTVQEILDGVENLIDALPEIGYVLECDVDGIPVTDVWSYRAQSPVFYGQIAAGSAINVLDPDYAPAGPYGPAAADGFWLMVKPLSPGEHVIHFHALLGTNLPEPVFETNVTHNITVVHGVGRNADESLAVESTTWGAIKAAYK